MRKVTGFTAGAVLMAGIGAATAGETPQILGAADYQALSKFEMSSITGEHRGHRHRGRINIRNVNNNVNFNQQQQAQCLLLCAGGDINVVATPPDM